MLKALIARIAARNARESRYEFSAPSTLDLKAREEMLDRDYWTAPAPRATVVTLPAERPELKRAA